MGEWQDYRVMKGGYWSVW